VNVFYFTTMNYQFTNIEKYKQFVCEKLHKYKKRQRKIWNCYYDLLKRFNESIVYRSSHPTFEKQWYYYCLWELKHQPSIKTKYNIFKEKVEKKIHLYINILLKIKYLSNLDLDSMLYIVDYIH